VDKQIERHYGGLEMNHKSRTSQGGFSLVELMVVVAIIGVLASIAVPAVNKYIAKARQSEAKTNLSSLYTSEKAFYAEYTAFDPRFAAVGYSPEGQLRYNVGFAAGQPTATSSNGFNTPAAQVPTSSMVSAYCGTPAAPGTSGCIILFGANGAANPYTPTGTIGATLQTFLGTAGAVVHSAGGTDTWTMSDTKILTNTVNGIP
jgi:type IV pilus assembly protein PilA